MWSSLHSVVDASNPVLAATGTSRRPADIRNTNAIVFFKRLGQQVSVSE